MLEKLDLDDDGKLPIAIFADLVLTFSCVCVFVRVRARTRARVRAIFTSISPGSV